MFVIVAIFSVVVLAIAIYGFFIFFNIKAIESYEKNFGAIDNSNEPLCVFLGFCCIGGPFGTFALLLVALAIKCDGPVQDLIEKLVIRMCKKVKTDESE